MPTLRSGGRAAETVLDLHLRVVSDPIVDRLRRAGHADDPVALLRRSAEVAAAAARTPAPGPLVDRLAAFAGEGTLPALLAAESLASVRHRRADRALADLLARPEPVVRRHASWRLGTRPPTAEAIGPLLDQLVRGGLDTLHAHRTLRRWAGPDPAAMAGRIRFRLAAADDPAHRARLVDLLGLVAGSEAEAILRRLAADGAEAVSARIAAIGALGQRPGPGPAATLAALLTHDSDAGTGATGDAADDAPIGAHAALALDSGRPAAGCPLPDRAAGGLRIAQLVLAGGLDRHLGNGGRGDSGGVASLLVSLGENLAGRPEVDAVVTIGRGTVADALARPSPQNDRPLSYAAIAFGDSARPGLSPDEMWEHLPAIERGIRRSLRQAGPLDVLHLRMADAGTLAGAEVARAMPVPVPVCFSLAPDPHNVLRSLAARGLDRRSFVELEADGNLWFRARLVERLAVDAEQLALFPRSHPAELAADLGLDPGRLAPPRAAVVAEGIDIDLVRRAAARYRAPETAAVVADLAARLPPHRRGRPLLVTVGRLNPVKGMDRVVAAWASSPALHQRCNLVVVGGDLAHPSDTERAVLAAIDRVVPPDDPRRAGLVLLGGRPRSEVADLLAATGRGSAGAWAGGGIYVDGALKEEFGLAVLEALAAGLVVVAPAAGGPPTYVEHGRTGILVDAADDLAAGVAAAFDLVDRPGRSRRARRMVAERYSIDTMAAQLVALYRRPLGRP